MATPKWLTRLNVVVNVGIILLALGFTVRPEGPLGKRFSEARQRSRTKAAIAESWSSLIAAPQITDNVNNGPVVIEFGDYECPACRRMHPLLEDLARQAGVRIVYRHFPNSRTHPAAEGGAKAAICAENQGRFREMHAFLLTDDNWRKAGADWNNAAQAARIGDLDVFHQCMKSPEAAQRLIDDIEMGRRLGLQGSPSFVGKTRVHLGLPAPTMLTSLASGELL